jgi:hypothetical protein
MVNQTDSMGNQQAAMMQAFQQQQGKSLFRPTTWFK